MSRRVAITGCGLVTPAGCDLSTFWTSLMRGECHLRPLERFSVDGFESVRGAEVELAPEDEAEPPEAYRSRCLTLGLAAVSRAVEHARLPEDPRVRDRAGVVIGTTLGEERQVGDSSDRFPTEGEAAIDAGLLARVDNHRLAASIAERQGLGGPAVLMAAACSSGNAAIATAFDLLRTGASETMIACAADTLTRLTFCGFYRLGALSKSICRPYDTHRDGVSFGEGAGALVLEEWTTAEERGATILGEVVGYGTSNDAYHITAPDPSGDGFIRAIRQALSTTGVAPEAVDYVSAHGTGTAYNDLCEVRALHAVFGERAPTLPMSSIKSMIGHTNGAASAIEAVACVLALQHQAIPPTANITEQDPECAIDCVPGQGRTATVGTCLSLSAGFGGSNYCLVLRGAA